MLQYNTSLTSTAKQVKDITIRKRETLELELTVYPTSTTSGTPSDLTDCAVFGEVREGDGETVILDLLPAISATPATGIINVEVYIPGDTARGDYYYDILLQKSDGNYVNIFRGNFKILDSITDGEGAFIPGPTGVDISARIHSGYTRGLTMIPKGDSAITGTVTLDDRLGLVIQGHGATQAFAPGVAHAGSRSNIYWNSTSTVLPMIKIRGAQTVWRDLTLTGNNYNFSLAGKPTALFWISKESDVATGSGQHLFENLCLEYATAGFQIGSLPTENNCDLSLYKQINMRQLDKGFYFKNNQALNHSVERLIWYNGNTNTKIFHVEAGGDLTVTTLAVLSRCTILNLDQIYTGAETGIGGNNAFYRIRDAKLDNNAIGTNMLSVTGAYASSVPAHVIYDGLMLSGNGTPYNVAHDFCTLRGGVKLTFINSAITADIRERVRWFTSGHSGLTQLTFINCAFANLTALNEILDIDTSTGNLRLVGINNTSSGSTVLADDDTIYAGIG